MNIFRNKSFLFKYFVKVELSYFFNNKNVDYSRKLHRKVNFLIKTGVFFSLVGNYLRPSNNSRQLICNINAVVLIVITC